MPFLDRVRWLDAVLAGLIAVVGLWEMIALGRVASGRALLIVLAMTVAAGTYRLLPSLALGLVWVSSLVQVEAGLQFSLVQIAILLVAYGTARHGHPATVWLSGLSIPLGAAIVLVLVQVQGVPALVDLGRRLVPPSFTSLTSAFLLVVLLLATPWALGLVLRLRTQYVQARAAREQAEVEAVRAREIAELQAGQARLARDVHDVVGHSLTVILAQAESAEFLPDADLDRIRGVLANIATSARRSLRDVRQVLSTTVDDGGTGPERTAGSLDDLVEGVAAAGHDVRSTSTGTPRPMPPELDVVAFRVLQEMLTNALKHGRRDAPIDVTRTWGDDELVIEVRNGVTEPGDGAAPEGLGIVGMHRRLEAVGGRLVVGAAPIADRDGQLGFTATAWVPLRPRAGG